MYCGLLIIQMCIRDSPGAFIDSVMEHGDDSEDRTIIGYDENIMIYHSADEKEEQSETQEGKTSEEKTEEDEMCIRDRGKSKSH